MLSASDLRKNLKIEIDGLPWVITDFDFMKPGKGQAMYRCKMKNMITGSTMDRTYRSNDKFDKPDLDDRDVSFLYYDGNTYVFSDDKTFEEIYVTPEQVGDQAKFLIEDAKCTILLHNNQAIHVELPNFIEKQIQYTETAVRGDTTSNVLKPATVDGDIEVQVPLFVNQGDWIKIDTRSGEYSERIKKS
ncbi:MAG: elongation factor P [Lentisphaeria bacterium]|nr:elongation factor P [Lentisphaeria bacterium]NQZ68196.1 elongation factor P [Lentisphaeria bacterium]